MLSGTVGGFSVVCVAFQWLLVAINEMFILNTTHLANVIILTVRMRSQSEQLRMRVKKLLENVFGVVAKGVNKIGID